jgi:ankyrin repeat protein
MDAPQSDAICSFDQFYNSLIKHIDENDIAGVRSDISLIKVAESEDRDIYFDSRKMLSALKSAVTLKRVEITDALINAGVPATYNIALEDGSRKNTTLICLAVATGSIDLVKLFVQRNAHVQRNRLGDDDNRCLGVAITAHDETMVEYLLKEGVRPFGFIDDECNSNSFIDTFLRYAVSHHDTKIASLLLMYGYDIKKDIGALQWNYKKQIKTNKNIPAERTRLLASYQKYLSYVLDYAVGTNFDNENDESTLDFLTEIDLADINLSGVSANMKPITHDMLKSLGFKNSDKAIVSFFDVRQIADASRQQNILDQLSHQTKLLGELINDEGIYNFISLSNACKVGDINAVLARLSAGINPNGKNMWADNPIEIAAENGHLPIVKSLAAHPEIDKSSFVGAIDRATANHHDDIKTYLMSLIDANARDGYGYSLLDNACRHGNVAEVERLVLLGADVNAVASMGSYSWGAPLLLVVNKLKDQLYSKEDKTDCYVNIIKILLEHGAVVNNSYITAASDSKNADALKLILPHCNKEDVKECPWYLEAMFAAALSNNIEALDVLKEQGADLNAIYRGETLLTRLFDGPFNNFEKMVQVINHLVKLGADINKPNIKGDTPLHQIADKSNPLQKFHDMQRTLIKLALQLGANVNTVNNDHRSPISAAVNHNMDELNTSVFDLLIAYGAHPLSIQIVGHGPYAIQHVKRLCDLTKLYPETRDLLRYISDRDDRVIDKENFQPIKGSHLGKFSIYKTSDCFDRRLEAANMLKDVLLGNKGIDKLLPYQSELSMGKLKKIFASLSAALDCHEFNPNSLIACK